MGGLRLEPRTSERADSDGSLLILVYEMAVLDRSLKKQESLH